MSQKSSALPAISPWFYRFCLVLCFVVGKVLFRLRTKKDPALQSIGPGLLIVANHQSYTDPIFIATAFPRHRIHFVAGRYLFAGKWSKAIFSRLGVVAKEQMRPDAATIRELIALARKKQTLFLFPEGQRSIDGRSNPILPATGRLIKKLGLPVACVRLSGAYLSWPRWGKGLRLGKVSQETSLLFSADDVQALDADTLNSRLIAALDVDEYDAQLARPEPRRYRGKRRAERLDAVLHWCPACAAPFVLRASGDTICCTACELSVRMERSGLLTSLSGPPVTPSPAVWHADQRRAWHNFATRHGFSFGACIRETSGTDSTGQRHANVAVLPDGFAIRFADGETVHVAADDSKALFADFGDFFRLFAAERPLYIWPENGQAVIAVLDLMLSGYMQ